MSKSKDEQLLATRIIHFGFSTRVKNGLLNAGREGSQHYDDVTLGDVVRRCVEGTAPSSLPSYKGGRGMLAVRNFGKRCMAELEAELEKRGASIKIRDALRYGQKIK